MSGKISGQVYDYVLSHREQTVLLALADHAEHDGTEVRPSIDRIVWKTSLSRSTVRRAIKSMRDRGVLVVVKKAYDHHPTEYRIVFTPLVRKAAFVPKNREVNLDTRSETEGSTSATDRSNGTTEGSELWTPKRPRTRPMNHADFSNQENDAEATDQPPPSTKPPRLVKAGTPEAAAYLARLKASG